MDDGYTTTPGPWTPIGTRYAQDIRSRGREVFENQGIEAEVPMTFLFRFDSVTHTVTVRDRLSFGGQFFDIKSVNEIGFREVVEIVGVAGD